MEPAQLDAYRAIGFLWEYVFSAAMAKSLEGDNYIRPGEIEIDGIIGSPDLWNVRNNKVADTKATYKSARKLENMEKFFWEWLMQIKGYAWMMGVLEAELFVFCVNGDYKPPAPRAYKIDMKFSVHELRENWQMLKNHARMRGWKIK